MKYFFFLLFISLLFQLSGQTSKINSQISKLDNSQFVIDHSEKASFKVKGSAAQKLIRIGKPATAQLIKALDDEQRNIMAQYVLCHIWYNMSTFAGPKLFVKDSLRVSKYFLGEEKGEGLVISETQTNGIYKMYVREKDREEIKAYWKKKTGMN